MKTLSREALAFLACGRSQPLFGPDLQVRAKELTARLNRRRVLVIGGAGSIGAATVAELARFDLAALHVVDQNENGLTELVRDLRSRREGLQVSDFRTLPLDFGGPVMSRFLVSQQPYQLVLNFAALKHVRSEKDIFSLLQMLDTNVLKAHRLMGWLIQRGGTEHYFSVSTDKAANPVNLMGASKRLMEHLIFAPHAIVGQKPGVSSARFANVAFSAGSLLEGWLLRLEKGQPLAVPRRTRRYFLSLREAGQLCLLAAAGVPTGTIVIPRLDESNHLVDLEGIARALLQRAGLTPIDYEDETLARASVESDLARSNYPLLLTPLDTSGEKDYEEFVGAGEIPFELGLPNLMGIQHGGSDSAALGRLLAWIESAVAGQGAEPSKGEIVSRLKSVVFELQHIESNKQLDHRM